MNQKAFIGKTSDYGGAERIISVLLNDGKQISAIAGNEINSSKVAVLQADDGNYYAFTDTSPEVILENKSGLLLRPVEEEPEEELLPFQAIVFFDNSVYLSGDRADLLLGSTTPPLVAGIANLGQLKYLSSWYRDDCNLVTVGSDGTNTIAALAPCPFSAAEVDLESYPELLREYFRLVEPKWVGGGYVKAERVPLFTEDLIHNSISGEALPDNIQLPEYPRFAFAEPDQNLVQGSDEYSQSEVNDTSSYNYLEGRNWNYKHQLSGNSNTPAPPYYFATCNFVFSLPANFTFGRETEFDYYKTINSNLITQIQVRLSNLIFTQRRELRYQEEYSYQRTPALMNSLVSYACQLFGFGQFAQGYYVPISSTANWSGETRTQNKTYVKTVVEETWDYPISLAGTAPKQEYYTRLYDLQSTYTIESNSWQIQDAFPFGFEFKTPGEEIKTISWSDSINTIEPELLFLGHSGRESFYTNKVVEREVKFSRLNGKVSLPMLLFNYSQDFPEVIDVVETTEVRTLTTSGDLDRFDTFNYSDGEGTTVLDLEDSFYFEVKNSNIPPVSGNFVFRNEDNSPVARIIEALPINFKRTTTFLPSGAIDTIAYEDEEYLENPLVDNIKGAKIVLVSNTNRYFGEVTNYIYSEYSPEEEDLNIFAPQERDRDFTLTPETSALAKYRDVSSIIIRIDLIEPYTGDMVESGTLGLFSQDNCAALFKDKLFTPGYSEYCNLVAGTIYYSKNVINHLAEPEQTTEVYNVVGDRIAMGTPETGKFIPPEVESNPSTAYSVAYFPV